MVQTRATCVVVVRPVPIIPLHITHSAILVDARNGPRAIRIPVLQHSACQHPKDRFHVLHCGRRVAGGHSDETTEEHLTGYRCWHHALPSLESITRSPGCATTSLPTYSMAAPPKARVSPATSDPPRNALSAVWCARPQSTCALTS